MQVRRLKSVEVSEQPAIDVTALLRADIAKHDWDAVQIAGDKRAPVDLPETRKGGWWR